MNVPHPYPSNTPLIPLSSVHSPGHEEELGPVRGLGPLCLLDVVVVVDGVAAVVVVAVLDLQVGQELIVAVVAVAGLEKKQEQPLSVLRTKLFQKDVRC